jgi:type I restriction enzyme M protein
MAIKKSQLSSSIWQGCDELRGGMDASQYKDYVLVLLFVRYVSDKYADQKNALVDIPAGGSFADLVKLKGKKDIGDGINEVLSALAEANGLKGVIDTDDFADESKLGKGKEMQDRLSNLVAIFENPELDFSKNRAEGDDLLGDAYEYLMKHFAVESGKSKGQFYTPAEVSRIIAKVIGAHKAVGRTQTVYDPTCGSGSLLLKVAAQTPTGIAIYGQELDNATAALAAMNMWLHNEPTAVIERGQSTLSNPLFLNANGSLKTFDYAVANPPFSTKAWRNGFDPEHDLYERFTSYGIPPKKNGDYAFLLHILRSLKSNGKGAVILPHGVLFRGNAEGEIRSNIVKRGYVKGIIGLPANLFYGTGIPACIIVVDKENAAGRQGIFMVDASKGFVKDGNKNRLRERDIKKIMDVFEGQTELPRYSRFVPNEEIQRHEYNLNIPRYIDTSDPEDAQDIEAHLKGGIPNADIQALAEYWQVCPTLKDAIFQSSPRSGYSELRVPADDIKRTVLSHKEFEAFRTHVLGVFTSWRDKTTRALKGVSTKDHPKALIQSIADDLLAACADVRLIDKYDLYQHLMTYWAEVMQDDAYIITVDGWGAGNQVMRLQKETKGKNKDRQQKDIEGLAGLEGRLIPISLLIATHFGVDQKELGELRARLEVIGGKMDELRDEHGGEEGLLEEVIENAKITKGALQERIKEIKGDADFADELAMLQEYAAQFGEEAQTKKVIKEAEKALDRKVLAKYPALSLEEIKTLVVERKWFDALATAVTGEVDRRSQALTGRVKDLALRYAIPLPRITDNVETLSVKVEAHLKTMGFVWQ